MALYAGDVIRIYDGTIRPPGHKRFLCVWPEEGWFFRINSKAVWKPNFLVTHADNPECLDHDSYLELNGVVEYVRSVIDEALEDPANHLGYLFVETLTALIAHLPSVGTLAGEDRDIIVAKLTGALPPEDGA